MNKILLPTLLLTLLSCSHTKRTAGKLPMERAGERHPLATKCRRGQGPVPPGL